MKFFPSLEFEILVDLSQAAAAKRIGETVQPPSETRFWLFGDKPFEGNVTDSGFDISRIGVRSTTAKLRASGHFQMLGSQTVIKVHLRPSLASQLWFYGSAAMTLLFWLYAPVIATSIKGFFTILIIPLPFLALSYLQLFAPYWIGVQKFKRDLLSVFAESIIHPDHVR